MSKKYEPTAPIWTKEIQSVEPNDKNEAKWVGKTVEYNGGTSRQPLYTPAFANPLNTPTPSHIEHSVDPEPVLSVPKGPKGVAEGAVVPAGEAKAGGPVIRFGTGPVKLPCTPANVVAPLSGMPTYDPGAPLWKPSIQGPAPVDGNEARWVGKNVEYNGGSAPQPILTAAYAKPLDTPTPRHIAHSVDPEPVLSVPKGPKAVAEGAVVPAGEAKAGGPVICFGPGAKATPPKTPANVG